MILRRLASAIRRQDWFTILIELVVVVVGIILGLQFDNWNENRKALLDENQFLLRARSDFARTLLSQQEALESKTAVNEDLYFLLVTLEAGTLPDDSRARFVASLNTIGGGDTFSQNISVYGNADNLRPLLDAEIRSAIRAYDAYVTDALYRNQSGLAISVNVFTDLTRRFTWRAEPYGGLQIAFKDNIPLTWFSFDDLIKDRSFYNRLSIYYGGHVLRTERLENVIAETEKLITILDRAIAERGLAWLGAP